MTDMIKSQEKLQLQEDSKRLHLISAFYRKMVKEFNVQSRGAPGPPNYSMTLYFQSHLEDEANFYNRVMVVLDERIEELDREGEVRDA